MRWNLKPKTIMISKEEVQRIAKLARLELSEQEIEKMQKDLSSILDYFNLLKKVNTQKGAEINAEKTRTRNELRKDEAIKKNENLAGDLVQAAPDKKDGYIKVKNIF